MTSPKAPSVHSNSSTEQLAQDMKALTATEKKELLASEKDSDVVSTTTTLAPTAFTSSKIFSIHSRGIPVLRLPVPSYELEIPITDAAGNVVYVSTRAKRRSGNAILSAPDKGDLVASTYRFGPGKPPTMTLLTEKEGRQNVTTQGKWTSRQQEFRLESGEVFGWRYVREKRGEKKMTLLVCEAGGRRIAQLVRDEETRTEGTGRCTAGNGGEVQVDEEGMMGQGLKEEIILASCIMMLKKEQDRRRGMQFAMMAGAASGGP